MLEDNKGTVTEVEGEVLYMRRGLLGNTSIR